MIFAQVQYLGYSDWVGDLTANLPSPGLETPPREAFLAYQAEGEVVR